MIHLYGRPTSGNSYEAHWLMGFLGMSCRETEIRWRTGGRIKWMRLSQSSAHNHH